MDTEAEGRQAHTDHHQWAVTGEEGAVDAHPRREGDGEGGAEAEGGEDEEAVTMDTDLARTRGPGAGVRVGACHDHHTAGHPHGHHRAEGAVEVAMAGGTHHLEEEEGAGPLEEGAQATTRTTARDPGVEAEITDNFSLFSCPTYPIIRRRSGSCSTISLSGRCPVTFAVFNRLHSS